ncbi:response regulator [Paenibacillus algorifonticola]|uniref:response regulator transcription factor n=1 Tax=Paenibacillus algorifonticola TaxID=684063 RepID=UPI003D2DC538
MYKTIIVEDEPWIRKGIEEVIPWNELPLLHAGSFRDGLEALEWLACNEADIIITDIRMPKVDGIEMLGRIAATNGKQPKCIILSGYDDFSYAKKAIAYGVKEYLLKPINPQEIASAMEKLTVELDKESSTRNIELKNRVCEIILDDTTLAACEELPYSSLCLLLANEPLPQQSELQSGITLIAIPLGSHTVYCAASDEKDKLAEWLKLLPPFEANAARVSSAIFNGDAHSLQQAYREAEKQLHMLRCSTTASQVGLTPQDENSFALSVQKEGKQAVLKLLEEYEQRFHTFEERWIVYLQLWISISKHATSPSCLEGLQSLNELKRTNTLVSLAAWRSQQLEPLIDKLADGVLATNGSSSHTALSIKRYVEQNYRNSSLSLLEAAERFQLSFSYLSSLFKSQYGVNFTVFVTNLRVEEAKRMLSTSRQTVYEIGELVGFNDVKYFVRVFKKVTGITPSSYRELNGSL